MTVWFWGVKDVDNGIDGNITFTVACLLQRRFYTRPTRPASQSLGTGQLLMSQNTNVSASFLLLSILFMGSITSNLNIKTKISIRSKTKGKTNRT